MIYESRVKRREGKRGRERERGGRKEGRKERREREGGEGEEEIPDSLGHPNDCTGFSLTRSKVAAT